MLQRSEGLSRKEATRRELKQKDQASLVRATWRRRGLVMLLAMSMI